MPVPTGTATPWRGLLSNDTLVYVRDGIEPGPFELLAEALRADGVVRSLGPALALAESTSIELGWYGYLDDGSEVLCGPDGETLEGEYVEDPFVCIVALVDFDD